MEWLIYFIKFWDQIPTVALILLVGLLSKHQASFIKLTCLLCVSIMLNIILKWTFQVPLAPGINPNTYAFPSGHMQMSVVFYGGLLLHFYRPIFGLAYALLLGSISFMLVQQGYHSIFEIIGAVFVGTLMLGAYQRMIRAQVFENHPEKLIYAMPIIGGIGYTQAFYSTLPYPIFFSQIFCVLLGITLGLRCQLKSNP